MSMSMNDIDKYFTPETIGAVERTDTVISRGVIEGVHAMLGANYLLLEDVSKDYAGGQTEITMQTSYRTNGRLQGIAGYDGVHVTSPRVIECFDRSMKTTEMALRFSVFRYGERRLQWAKESIAVWNNGSVTLSQSQPFVEAVPLGLPHDEPMDVDSRKLRLLQNIIHWGNRAALARIAMISVTQATGKKLESTEDIAMLQAEWSAMFTKVAGQSTITHSGYDYMPGIHMSLLSRYAVIR